MNSGETLVRSNGRPANQLLQRLTERDYHLIERYLERVKVSANQILYHPGDKVEAVAFPCGSTMISFAVSLEVDRDVHAIAVGMEGAVGGIISSGLLPTYSRTSVIIGGEMIRLSVRKLEPVMRQSPSLRGAFARYADFLFAQTLQSAACNAGHSNEQRAARCILSVKQRTGDVVPLTHEQLASMLGVGRSYTSRLLEKLKSTGMIETKRAAILVTDEKSLRKKSCGCDGWLKSHFHEIFLAG
jgi:CRP-like cAMP-binding protein